MSYGFQGEILIKCLLTEKATLLAVFVVWAASALSINLQRDLQLQGPTNQLWHAVTSRHSFLELLWPFIYPALVCKSGFCIL